MKCTTVRSLRRQLSNQVILMGHIRLNPSQDYVRLNILLGYEELNPFQGIRTSYLFWSLVQTADRATTR